MSKGATERSFIYTGDVHMSNKLPHAKPTTNGRTDRLEDQHRLWDHIIAEAIERRVDGIKVLGDLFDKAHLDPVTLAETAGIIKRAAEVCPVFILPGNHDASTTRGGRYNVEALSAIPNVVYMGAEPFYFEVDWLRFWPVPYAGIEDNKATLAAYRKALKKDKRAQHVCLFHNNVYGCKHLAWVCDDGIDADELCEGFDLVLAGHFHTHQKFGDNGMYLGAPMQHSFSDCGERRGFWHITYIKGAGPDMEFIETDLPRFYKLLKLQAPKRASEGDYVRYEIEATHADWEAMRHGAQELVGVLRDSGIHASYKHKAIYHHEERLVTSGEMESLSMDEMVSKYIGAKDVVTGSMDRELLLMLGRQFMEEARRDS